MRRALCTLPRWRQPAAAAALPWWQGGHPWRAGQLVPQACRRSQLRLLNHSAPALSLRNKEADDSLSVVFDSLAENGKLPLQKFMSALTKTGVREADFRLRASMEKFHKLVASSPYGAVDMDKDTFLSCASPDFVLISRAFKSLFVIPEFGKLTNTIDEMYWQCKSNCSGKVASYIPQLSRVSPDYWAVSLCTIDGQRHSVGDTSVPFCLQSCSKPLTYAYALNDLGSDVVHQYVGQEPSGLAFNELVLDRNKKPHNPMINAGAIVLCSLLKNNLKLPDRFDYFMSQTKRMNGGEYLGFHNSTFLSERETADRNFALAYFMKENKCFPEGTHLQEVLDFYFQCCSIEITAESGSVIAATLANGGICPVTGDKVLSGESVRDTCSLMYSCGMYDYSGQFAFRVGLPGKSGVAGGIILVIPNVMGICMWSPPLDALGNSCRGVQFCTKLVEAFNFHNYDNLRHTTKKYDPRQRAPETKVSKIASLLYAAFNNDINMLRRHYLSATDMNQADYDGRTALHVAAAEGHMEACEFLLEKCRAQPDVRDRWGRMPVDDASMFGHTAVVELFTRHMKPKTDGSVSS